MPSRFHASLALAPLLVVACFASARAQPPNDSCAAPTVIPSIPFFELFELQAASTDGIPGCPIVQDAWFVYAAPADGNILVEGSGGPEAEISIYEVAAGTPGTCPDDADRIACAAPGFSLVVSANSTYFFQVGLTASPYATLKLQWYNDLCTFAEAIPSLPFDGFAEHEFATNDGIPGCPLDRDFWYRFDPIVGGEITYEADLIGFVSIYESSSLPIGACPTSADRIICSQELGVLTVVAGQSYFFQVGRTGSAALGIGTTLFLDWLVPPGNDTCVGPLALTVPANVPVDFLTAGDSLPSVPCAMPHDLWFSYTAPMNGSIRIEVDANGDALALYRDNGGCPLPAVLLECGVSPIFHDVIAGEAFLVQAGSASPGSGDGISVVYALPPGVPDDRYTLSLPPVSVPPDLEFEMSVVLDAVAGGQGPATPLQGWAYSVCIDPAELEVLDLSLGAATLGVNGGGPPDAYSTNIIPGEGFTSAAIISFTGAAVLPPGTGLELEVATCRPLVPPPEVIVPFFCDTVGSPPVTVVFVTQGLNVTPITVSGAVSVVEPPRFRRGDANGDGSNDIADAIRILGHLFPTAGAPPVECELAADSNDDELLNIADAVALLASLFGSPTVPLPLPQCGPDPSPGPLTCDVRAACP